MFPLARCASGMTWSSVKVRVGVDEVGLGFFELIGVEIYDKVA